MCTTMVGAPQQQVHAWMHRAHFESCPLVSLIPPGRRPTAATSQHAAWFSAQQRSIGRGKDDQVQGLLQADPAGQGERGREHRTLSPCRASGCGIERPPGPPGPFHALCYSPHPNPLSASSHCCHIKPTPFITHNTLTPFPNPHRRTSNINLSNPHSFHTLTHAHTHHRVVVWPLGDAHRGGALPEGRLGPGLRARPEHAALAARPPGPAGAAPGGGGEEGWVVVDWLVFR